jgi:hypothetical protein
MSSPSKALRKLTTYERSPFFNTQKMVDISESNLVPSVRHNSPLRRCDQLELLSRREWFETLLNDQLLSAAATHHILVQIQKIDFLME